MNDILIIIPARYASTRLEGKPLQKIMGKEMILRVAEIAQYIVLKNINTQYIVATDDERIIDFCNLKNIPVTMTDASCNSGTERCWNVVKKKSAKPALIINLQGDNPLCPPWFLQQLIDTWKSDTQGAIFTPFVQLNWQEYDALVEQKKQTPHSGTCVLLDSHNLAITFSKNMIPAIRKIEKERQKPLSPICRHIGLYAYTYQALESYFNLPKSRYEDLEGLEQLRFIENRIPVKMVEVNYCNRKGMNGVDSIQDVQRAEKIIQQFGEFDFIL